MTTKDSSFGDWRPRHSPWLIAVSVMTATFLEVLDTSVANVALPHIAGNLSVTTNEATWVLTSYLVSNAIVLPMTGWLGNYFGRKRLLLICIGLFTLASALCGMAPSLSFLVLARAFQGVGGGALLPISQAILLESFPREKQGVGMSVFAMGVVVAPILGPTLGGWITDNYTWRWVFYINLPIGLLALFLVEWMVEDPPYIRRDRQAPICFTGFALLALWLATLQIVLDKGQQEDWFASRWICWFSAISGAAFVAFIWREFSTRHPIVNLRILGNRNFGLGLLLMTLVGGVLYGTTAALPIFLQTLMGYPALQSGLALSPRGVGAFLATFIMGRLVDRVRNRYLIAFGFGMLATSSFWLGKINLEMGMINVIAPTVLNGIAISFIFVPLTTATMGHLRQDQMGNAAGIFNLMRNLGGSIGIASVTTFLARWSQAHQAMMVAHVTPYNPIYREQLTQWTAALAHAGNPALAAAQAHGLIYRRLLEQAQLWAFIDDFRLFGLLCLGCIPLVFLFKRVGGRRRNAAVH